MVCVSSLGKGLQQGQLSHTTAPCTTYKHTSTHTHTLMDLLSVTPAIIIKKNTKTKRPWVQIMYALHAHCNTSHCRTCLLHTHCTSGSFLSFSTAGTVCLNELNIKVPSVWMTKCHHFNTLMNFFYVRHVWKKAWEQELSWWKLSLTVLTTNGYLQSF